jgi:NAD(P)-dependent dehydrogenase (short-subunit alcohol dehydrogenase family)
MLCEVSDTKMQKEMDVNVFGKLRMIKAFAPVLAGNGGGVIVNILSVVSWFTAPLNMSWRTCALARFTILFDVIRAESKKTCKKCGISAGACLKHGLGASKLRAGSAPARKTPLICWRPIHIALPVIESRSQSSGPHAR